MECDDQVNGNAGHDHLFGNQGRDNLSGGSGNDYLGGGHYDGVVDVLWDEQGADTYVGEWFIVTKFAKFSRDKFHFLLGGRVGHDEVVTAPHELNEQGRDHERAGRRVTVSALSR